MLKQRNGGEGGICSQSDVLDTASCRNEYATDAKIATVATPHCPLLPADHVLLMLPTWEYPKTGDLYFDCGRLQAIPVQIVPRECQRTELGLGVLKMDFCTAYMSGYRVLTK